MAELGTQRNRHTVVTCLLHVGRVPRPGRTEPGPPWQHPRVWPEAKVLHELHGLDVVAVRMTTRQLRASLHTYQPNTPTSPNDDLRILQHLVHRIT
jgi:hypothetical protein